MTWQLIDSRTMEWIYVPGSGNLTTTPMNTTNADLLVIAGGSRQSIPAIISDNQGNAWLSISNAISTTYIASVFYAMTTSSAGLRTAASHTFTIAPGQQSLFFIAMAFRGAAKPPMSVLDIVTLNNSAMNTGTAGSVMPAQDNSLIISGVSGSWGAPFNDAAPAARTLAPGGIILGTRTAPDDGNNVGGAGYFIQSTAAAINPTWGPLFGTNAVCAAVFRPLGGAGGAVAASGGRINVTLE